MTPDPAVVIRATKHRFHKDKNGWEDYLSEAWFEAVRRARLHDPARQSLEMYIYHTCTKGIKRYRYLKSHVQRRHPRGHTISDFAPTHTPAQTTEPDPAQNAQHTEQTNALHRHISHLPKPLRLVLIEYLIEGRPVPEIMKDHGISECGVYDRIKRAINLLREVMNPDAPISTKRSTHYLR